MPAAPKAKRPSPPGTRQARIKLTKQAASHEFGMADDTVTKRLKEANQEPDKDGKYTIKQLVDAIFGNITGERLRKTRAEADLLEAKRKKIEGELVEIEAVEWAWGRILMPLRQSLEAMPSKMQSQLGLTEEQTHAIEDEIQLILSIASDPTVYEKLDRAAVSDQEDDGGKPKAKAKAKRKSVGGRKPASKPRGKR